MAPVIGKPPRRYNPLLRVSVVDIPWFGSGRPRHSDRTAKAANTTWWRETGPKQCRGIAARRCRPITGDSCPYRLNEGVFTFSNQPLAGSY